MEKEIELACTDKRGKVGGDPDALQDFNHIKARKKTMKASKAVALPTLRIKGHLFLPHMR